MSCGTDPGMVSMVLWITVLSLVGGGLMVLFGI